MNIAIPGRRVLHLEHVVLDVNGTVAAGGKLVQGVREQMWALRQAGWQVHWITADTRGLQADLDVQVGWPAVRIKPTGVEGEAMATYLAQNLKSTGLTITRIGLGLPAGGGLEFADEMTLRRALESRQPLL